MIKNNWVEITRLFTAPLSFLAVTLISILLWVYQNDRYENKQTDEKIIQSINSGFSEMAKEFKEIHKNEAEYREKIATQLATVKGIQKMCCPFRGNEYE